MRDALSLRVLIAALAIGLILTCVVLVYIFVARPASTGLTDGPAALTLIPAPTSTSFSFTPTSNYLTPTAMPTTTPVPGQISVGAYVQISGTGGDGLRLRSEPGLSGTQLSLGYDTEIFRVGDGPREVDGHIWWYLASPYDDARSGWAVQDYLTVIETP